MLNTVLISSEHRSGLDPNSLGPEQNIGLIWIQNVRHSDSDSVLKRFFEKLILKKMSRWQKNMKNYRAGKEVNFTLFFRCFSWAAGTDHCGRKR